MIAGIDYNSHGADVVLLDEDKNEATWRHFTFAGTDAFDRARHVRDAMYTRGWWMDSPVLAVFIEDPGGRGRQFDTSALFRIQGAILATLPPELAVEKLLPHQWKPRCGLKGNAKKWEIDSWAHEAWANRPIEANQDAHDAFGIAYAGRQLYVVTEIGAAPTSTSASGGGETPTQIGVAP